MSDRKPAIKVIESILLELDGGDGVKLKTITEESMDNAYTDKFHTRRCHISTLLSRMKKQNRAEKVKWGYWRLTEDRERYLRERKKEKERDMLASGDVL